VIELFWQDGEAICRVDGKVRWADPDADWAWRVAQRAMRPELNAPTVGNC
jgi:hypothetical protein